MLMLRRALLLAAASTSAALTGTSATPASANALDPTAYGGTYLGAAPDPVAHAAWGGSRFTTLQASPDRRIYYGYGNYGTNSGTKSGLGVNVAYFDVATSTFRSAVKVNGEELNTYRLAAGGRVLTANIDPTTGGAAFAASTGGVWTSKAYGMEHVFDVVQGLDSNDIMIAGSANTADGNTAYVLRSRDGGATWTQVYRWFDADPANDDANDAARAYWLTKIGTKVYWRGNPGITGTAVLPFMAFDLTTGRSAKVGEAKLKTGWTLNGRTVGVGESVTVANGVVSTGTLAYFVEHGSLWWFDGTNAGTVSNTTPVGYRYDTVEVAIDPVTNTVYSRDQSGIYKVTGKTRALVKSLQSGYDDAAIDNFTVLGGVAYVGQDAGAKLFRLPLN